VTDARTEILARVRTALADVPAEERPDDVAVERGYRRSVETPRAALLAQFRATVEDYGAGILTVAPDEVPEALEALCRSRGSVRLVVPPGLPAQWRPEGLELVEDRDLAATALDEVDGVITGCAAAIAQTGTLVLDGGARSGRRVITLVPDHHLCVVEADQVVGLVPEAVARVAAGVRERGTPITLVSGPSASSDIELNRVEGVHGPRRLDVVIVEAGN
jgi:L-lactate dehydrogenase complex protein LldG